MTHNLGFKVTVYLHVEYLKNGAYALYGTVTFTMTLTDP